MAQCWWKIKKKKSFVEKNDFSLPEEHLMMMMIMVWAGTRVKHNTETLIQAIHRDVREEPHDSKWELNLILLFFLLFFFLSHIKCLFFKLSNLTLPILLFYIPSPMKTLHTTQTYYYSMDFFLNLWQLTFFICIYLKHHMKSDAVPYFTYYIHHKKKSIWPLFYYQTGLTFHSGSISKLQIT